MKNVLLKQKKIKLGNKWYVWKINPRLCSMSKLLYRLITISFPPSTKLLISNNSVLSTKCIILTPNKGIELNITVLDLNLKCHCQPLSVMSVNNLPLLPLYKNEEHGVTSFTFVPCTAFHRDKGLITRS